MTQLLSIGYPQSMLAAVVYALPSSNLCRLTCDDATVAFTISNDGITFTSATLSGSGYDNGFAFIKADKDATINIRRWQA